jgi:hypothetical protein
MLHPGILEKAMKHFSIRNGGPTKINDSECLKGLVGGWEVSSQLTYHDHGYLVI